jgi:hypothetical protein
MQISRIRLSDKVVDGTPKVHPLAGNPDHLSSRCQRSLGRGRRRRSRPAIVGPNFNTQLRMVSWEMSSPPDWDCRFADSPVEGGVSCELVSEIKI